MRRLVPALVLAAALAGCGSAPGARPPAAAPATTQTTPATTTKATTTPTTTAAASPTTTAAATAARPCLGTPPPPRWDHVVLIVMENRGLDQVAGSRSAPYLDSLAAACGLATRYSGVAHPSLPNYLALTSGSTHGVTDDAGPSAHPLPGPSIFSLLGTDWRTLAESMPAPCDRSSAGEYATKHNPAVYYTALASCPARDVPMDDGAPDVSARFTLIVPNLCDDGHDCPTSIADRWLSREVPLILNSAQYRAGRTALVITWDENDEGGTLVPTYVITPSVVPGTRSAAPFDHYSLLRTVESMLGLTPLLGAAESAPDMREAFHL